jgi:hypothetical protein
MHAIFFLFDFQDLQDLQLSSPTIPALRHSFDFPDFPLLSFPLLLLRVIRELRGKSVIAKIHVRLSHRMGCRACFTRAESFLT